MFRVKNIYLKLYTCMRKLFIIDMYEKSIYKCEKKEDEIYQ